MSIPNMAQVGAVLRPNEVAQVGVVLQTVEEYDWATSHGSTEAGLRAKQAFYKAMVNEAGIRIDDISKFVVEEARSDKKKLLKIVRSTNKVVDQLKAEKDVLNGEKYLLNFEKDKLEAENISLNEHNDRLLTNYVELSAETQKLRNDSSQKRKAEKAMDAAERAVKRARTALGVKSEEDRSEDEAGY